MLVSGTTRRPRTIDDLMGPELMARLNRLDVLSRRTFAGRLPGERRSKRRGRSVEFADYRNYTVGDDLRHVDWKVYARLDRLFVKLFMEEEDLAVHVAVDISPSMDAGDPNKLVFCQRLAMALGYIGLVNRNRVSMTLFGGGPPRRLPEMRGRREVRRLGGFLLDADQSADAADATSWDFARTMRALAATRTGSGVMIVLSDFLLREGYEEGLRLLAGRGGFETHCLHVLSPGEIDPERERNESLGGGLVGDLRLTDVETGAATEVTVSAALLASYRKSLERHCADLDAFCSAREMRYMLVRSDTPVETLVMEQLRRRGLLR